jgi:DNA-binding protein HU-beta
MRAEAAVSNDRTGASKEGSMQKTEFIKAVAERAGVGQKEAKQIVESALTVIADTLARGEKVTLTGFGTFELRERAARAGVNPQTKEKLIIAAARTPGFSASGALKAAIKGA